WGNGPYFLKTEIDPNGGTSYSISGTTQLISVPYALFAEHALTVENDQVNDADSNPTNEIQTLTLVGSNLSISGGNSVTLTSASGNTLDQSYDQGGAGAGRIINVDAGEVQMNTASANGIALRLQNTNTGVGLISTSS